VPPAENVEAGFFIDLTEVSTAAYRACVMAGRCVQAKRIVLTPEAVRTLGGVEGVDTTATPEQLASAWGNRCNETRDEKDHPVNCVNQASATDYCRFVGKRLPTAAEWTRAATGGDDRRFPWGSAKPTCATACYGLNGSCHRPGVSLTTCAVGARPDDRSPAGVVDLAGNVSEWVSDAIDDGSASGPPYRVIRGGSFADEADALTSANQRALPPASAHVSIGFRCALNAPAGFVVDGR